MYLRAIHAEPDILALRHFIRENPLGILVTALPSTNYPTLQCTHIPWVLDVIDEDSKMELGVLRGHLAKQNPHSKAMMEAVEPVSKTSSNGQGGADMELFGRAGLRRATIFFDSQSDATGTFLDKQIMDLTNHAERTIMNHTGIGGRPAPWEVTDAPSSYIDILRKSIIGIEITIDRLERKYKVSQEMSLGDREGVIEGFESLGTDDGVLMAKTVQERGAMKDTLRERQQRERQSNKQGDD